MRSTAKGKNSGAGADQPRRHATGREKGETALDLDAYLPHHLTVIANRWARGSSRIYLKRFGIGVNEWRIMSMIAVEPGVTAQRAGEVTAVDKGPVSRAVKLLVERGLVNAPQDRNDARKTSLTLTREGYALHDRIMALALERQNRLVAGLSAEEIALFARLLARMRGNLPAVNAQEFMKDGGPARTDVKTKA